MAGITFLPQNAAQNAVRTLQQRPATGAKPDDAETKRLQELRDKAAQAAKLLATLAKPDENTAKHLQDLRDAAARMNQTAANSAVDTKAERRKAAKQRLDMIKEALRTLKMFGADPKLAAREAARLASELAKVVKEYQAAGGGAVATGTVPTAAASTAPTAAAGQAAAGGTAAGAAGAGDGAVAATAGQAGADGQAAAAGAAAAGDTAEAPAVTSADAAAAGAATTEGKAEGDTATGTDAKGEASAGAGDARAAEAKALADAKAAETKAGEAQTAQGKDGSGKADEEKPGADGFARDARAIAKKLRMFLEKQMQKLRAEAGADAGDDVKRVVKDVRDALDSLRQTEQVVRSMPGGNEGESPMEGVDMLI